MHCLKLSPINNSNNVLDITENTTTFDLIGRLTSQKARVGVGVRCWSEFSSRFFFLLCTSFELLIFTLFALKILHLSLRVPCIQTPDPPHRAPNLLALGVRQHVAHQHSQHSFRTRRKSASPSLELTKHSAQLWLIRVKKSREGFRVSRDMILLVQPWSPIHKGKLTKKFLQNN